ncbi:Uncharacterised protein [Bordetella pertussis]|nr:Uncharacterised protein [Bordetella pertussis]
MRAVRIFRSQSQIRVRRLGVEFRDVKLFCASTSNDAISPSTGSFMASAARGAAPLLDTGQFSHPPGGAGKPG